MKLFETESFIKQGIRMYRVLNKTLFYTTYEYKTVYDLDETVKLHNEGWCYRDGNVFNNLTLNILRDLQDTEIDGK